MDEGAAATALDDRAAAGRGRAARLRGRRWPRRRSGAAACRAAAAARTSPNGSCGRRPRSSGRPSMRRDVDEYAPRSPRSRATSAQPPSSVSAPRTARPSARQQRRRCGGRARRVGCGGGRGEQHGGQEHDDQREATTHGSDLDRRRRARTCRARTVSRDQQRRRASSSPRGAARAPSRARCGGSRRGREGELAGAC